MHKLILFLSFLIQNCKFQQQQQINEQKSQSLELSNLYQFWKGNGVAYQLPKSLRILTHKVQNQVGQMYSYKPITAGGYWTIRYNVNLDCLKFSDDLGVVLWLSQVNPRQNVNDYTYQNQAPFFGGNSFANGLMVLYTHDSINVGFYNKKFLTREDILYGSKTCKIFADQNNSVTILIRYTDFGNLGVYFIDPKTGLENLCRQEQEILNFGKFYISVAGTDRNGQCSAEVKDFFLDVSNKTQFNIVDYKQKKIDDENYAYYEESLVQKQWVDLENYEAILKDMREDAKIMANELLKFADKNEKEIAQEFKERMQQQIQKSDVTLEIIEKEAQTIQSLSDYTTSDKRSKNEDFNHVLEQMLIWMRQLDESFDKVDKETQTMYDSINEIGLNEKVNQLIEKSDLIQKKLSNILFKTKYIKKQNQKNSLQTKNLQKLIKNVEKFNKNSENLSQQSQEKFSKLRSIGLSILVVLSVVIIAAFLTMYLKINNATQQKRVLQLIFLKQVVIIRRHMLTNSNPKNKFQKMKLMNSFQNNRKTIKKKKNKNKKIFKTRNLQSQTIKLKPSKGRAKLSFNFYEKQNQKLTFKNQKMDKISKDVIQKEQRIRLSFQR